MNKYKVTKAFNDKYTHERREVGEEIAIDNNRAKELAGYVEEIKKVEKAEVNETEDEE